MPFCVISVWPKLIERVLDVLGTSLPLSPYVIHMRDPLWKIKGKNSFSHPLSHSLTCGAKLQKWKKTLSPLSHTLTSGPNKNYKSKNKTFSLRPSLFLTCGPWAHSQGQHRSTPGTQARSWVHVLAGISPSAQRRWPNDCGRRARGAG